MPNSPEQEAAELSAKSVQAVSKQSVQAAGGRAPKSHPNFWKQRLFHPSYTREGDLVSLPEWAVKIQFRGERETFTFGTANQTAAAVQARDIYASLLANGWEATRLKFKPEHTKKVIVPSVGEYLTAVRAISGIAVPTLETYAVKFRTVVAGVCKIEAGAERFSAKGAAAWRNKVEAVKLSRITPEAVQRWSVSYLSATGLTPAQRQSRETTLNSIIRGSRCLFTSRILRHLKHLSLPSPLPFEGVEAPRVARKRYVSKFSVSILYAKAEMELRDAVGLGADDKREAFAILSLALFAGLRRDEIDTLTWRQIDWERGQVSIETNEFTSAKTANSEGTVTLPSDVVEYLRAKKTDSASQFVINSPITPRPNAARYHHYRCNRLFDVLKDWLRENGVSDRNPLHALRKEFGSLVAKKFGVLAASEALRHTDIRLTRDYYLSRDDRATISPADLRKEA
jgi:integrase